MTDNVTETITRGRKALSPIERARNTLIKAIAEKKLVDSEYHLNFDFEDYSEEEIDSIKLNANCRLTIARKIDEISAEIKELGSSEPDSDKLEELKETRTDLQVELHEMAPLGISHEDWEESRDVSALEPGRKRLEIEYRFNRVNDSYDEALSTYRQLEIEAGMNPVSIEELSEMEVTTSTSGRPKADQKFRNLDRECARYKKNYLTALEESEGFQLDENARGRKKVHPLEKAKTYLEKMNSIVDKIHLEEKQLSKDALLERAKGIVSLSIKRTIKSIAASTTDKKRASLEKELEGFEETLERILDQQEELTDTKLTWAYTQKISSATVDRKLAKLNA